MEKRLHDMLETFSLWFFLDLAKVLAAFLCLWGFYLLKLGRGKRLLDKIPGYKDWPIVGDVLHLKRDPVEFYDQVIELLTEARLRKITTCKIRIGIWAIICLYTPEDSEKLLRSNVLIDKSDDYEYLHPWLGFGLLTSTGAKWKTRRRMLTPSFHFNILQDFLLTMNNHAATLKDKLQEDACDKGSTDVFPIITLNSLDMICDTAMGVDMGALHDGESDYVKAVYLVKEAVAVRQRTPWYWPDFIYNSLPVGRKVNKAIDTMHQYAYKVIRERQEMKGEVEFGGKHKAFLDILLECRDEHGNALTDEEIREEVDTFMFEGHDTVSAATAHTVHLLGANLDAQRRCQKELDEIMDSPRDFTMDDLAKMTYLDWCIKESLRLFPSVPWFGRALAEDTDFGGYTVPKGTTAAVFTISLHRDPAIFPDPETFDPTRFSPDKCANRHPYAYVPFSAGPRNCIGQKFAMMELKVIMATILLNFNLVSTQKRDEVKPNPGLVLQPSAGIWVKLSSRT
ncbi:cytochrome P450 4V2-like [Watersipora subatra]|uniref:cytochrome P450 4V2-like n=1 Tax=Watersipora subatra TaxID=2589382 RepID=UPI00355C6B65